MKDYGLNIEEYLKDFKDQLLEMDDLLAELEIHTITIDEFMNEVKKKSVQNLNEGFPIILTETQFRDCYDICLSNSISSSLNLLHSRGHIEAVSVDENGEINYSLTQEGRIYMETVLKSKGESE